MLKLFGIVFQVFSRGCSSKGGPHRTFVAVRLLKCLISKLESRSQDTTDIVASSTAPLSPAFLSNSAHTLLHAGCLSDNFENSLPQDWMISKKLGAGEKIVNKLVLSGCCMFSPSESAGLQCCSALGGSGSRGESFYKNADNCTLYTPPH